jgi:hypothetical protein
MTIEDLFRKLFGKRYHDEQVDRDIELAWQALEPLRQKTRDIRHVEWVKLSSMTNSQGDIGGAVIGGELAGVQLFVSRIPVRGASSVASGYSISEFSSGAGITELWSSGVSVNSEANLAEMLIEFERHLGRNLK